MFMMQQEPRTWRELLQFIILDPEEKKRIALELGITTITLDRWASREHSPTLNKLRRLLASIQPDLRQQFGELIAKEYTEFAANESSDALPAEIPRDFWRLLMRTRRETSNRYWQVCSLALQWALVQLDASRLGTEIIVVRCMPPREGKVRSLRESVGMGTRPWRGDLQKKQLFLGAESLAGYAVTTAHEAVVQDIEKDSALLPVHHVSYEKSAAAFPIVCEGWIAGCLLVSSTQLDFFLLERLALLMQYADALTLAFKDTDFYPPSSIELRVMPHYTVQEKSFRNFAARRDTLLERAKMEERSMNAVQAEQLVGVELEGEFLHGQVSHLEARLATP
jgi:hypothetical protein